MNKFKTYFKLQWRMLKKTKTRFLSVFLIIFIGTAFFAGLRISPMVMRTSTDAYLDEQNYADLTLIPTYGASLDDIEEIAKIDGVQKVTGAYFFDALATYREYQDGVKVYSFQQDIQTPYITEGKTSLSDDECLIDPMYANKYNIQIGDQITLQNKQGEKKFTVQGFAKDTRQMIFYSRGTNEYGSGQSSGFIIINETPCIELGLNQDLLNLLDVDHYYNQLLIQVKGAKDLIVFSNEYSDLLNGVEADINDLMDDRLNKKYESIIGDKLALLEGPEKEYQEGLLAYENGVKQLDIEKKEAEVQLIENQMKILEGKQKLIDAKSEFSQSSQEITSSIDNLQSELNNLQNELKKLKDQNEDEGSDVTPPFENPSTQLPQMDDVFAKMESSINTMNQSLNGINQFIDASTMIKNSELALDKAELQLEIGKQQLSLSTQKAQEKLDQAKIELDEAKSKIDQAKEEINRILKPSYYLLNQDMNEGIASFKSDADRIDAIAQLFPMAFFLVAALVSLTTMTRMVEEQRSQNGTMRALGYTKFQVMLQYILYALFATLLGSCVGIGFGTYFFPRLIYGLYSKLMYDIPHSMVYCWDNQISLLTIVIAVIVTLIATIASSTKDLSNMPAILMRPKAPKTGKRILLERIGSIWKKLNFNQKVTMRNIFRYKKRFFMSVIGISGCTALLLTGFGLKYSLLDMTNRQFKDLWFYDSTIVYDQLLSLDDITLKKENLKTIENVDEVLCSYQTQVNARGTSKTEADAFIVVPSSLNRLDDYFSIHDTYSKEKFDLETQGVFITQKLSELLSIDVGETLNVTISDQTYELYVSGIAENYMRHYIYMSKDYYETVFDDSLAYNTCFINLTEGEAIDEEQIGKEIMEDDDVASITFTSDINSNFKKQMQSVDIVVWVLIISAGLLAFVVLYNLTNININERLSEIATIKVLGFRNHEVYDYIFRENNLLSIIGTVIGLFLGIILHHFVMTTVEVDMIMFVRTIRPISYLYATSLTMLFTWLINLFMRKILKSIDMVSSLKSIE